jgi:hypothetical protein
VPTRIVVSGAGCATAVPRIRAVSAAAPKAASDAPRESVTR